MEKGNISVQSENIFLIIKTFLYSDQEVFLRELISNAMDATSKLKTLSVVGDFKGEIGDTTIEVSVDKDAKTITIKDRGIGMTEDEVKKYLNQLAFSSAQEFLEKYKDDSNIIGHFGLGFYSAFMVAAKVEVKTVSYKKGSKGILWVCEGDPEYMIGECDKKDRGTEIILHVGDDDKEYLEESKIQRLLDKYCKFLPVPIKFGTKTETIFEGEGDEKEEKEVTVDNIINNPNPAWKKQPSELTDEDYLSFYNELYPFSAPPMFWIHLNIDYPFDLTGILYFPKLDNTIEVQKNKIKLYSNQVYVTDDIKEIVPEFLTLLHGVIDSPDIPLNVSRSALQSDRNVKKITGYITKKVAEKLGSIYKDNREDYENKWKDLDVFVKYGLLSEEKFYDKAIDFTLLKDTEGKYFTINEYKDLIKENQTDKDGKLVILYANNLDLQYGNVNTAKNAGYNVLELNSVIDSHFIQQLEYKMQELKFARVDADTIDKLIEKDEEVASVLSEKDQEKVEALFKTHVNQVGASVELKSLSPNDMPVMITKPEFMRRMQEMQAAQGMGLGNMPETYNVVINTNHPIIGGKLLKMRSAEKKEKFASYLYNLALVNQGMLKGKDLTDFVSTSIEFMTD